MLLCAGGHTLRNRLRRRRRCDRKNSKHDACTLRRFLNDKSIRPPVNRLLAIAAFGGLNQNGVLSDNSRKETHKCE